MLCVSLKTTISHNTVRWCFVHASCFIVTGLRWQSQGPTAESKRYTDGLEQSLATEVQQRNRVLPYNMCLQSVLRFPDMCRLSEHFRCQLRCHVQSRSEQAAGYRLPEKGLGTTVHHVVVLASDLPLAVCQGRRCHRNQAAPVSMVTSCKPF